MGEVISITVPDAEIQVEGVALGCIGRIGPLAGDLWM